MNIDKIDTLPDKNPDNYELSCIRAKLKRFNKNLKKMNNFEENIPLIENNSTLICNYCNKSIDKIENLYKPCNCTKFYHDNCIKNFIKENNYKSYCNTCDSKYVFDIKLKFDFMILNIIFRILLSTIIYGFIYSIPWINYDNENIINLFTFNYKDIKIYFRYFQLIWITTLIIDEVIFNLYLFLLGMYNNFFLYYDTVYIIIKLIILIIYSSIPEIYFGSMEIFVQLFIIERICGFGFIIYKLLNVIIYYKNIKQFYISLFIIIGIELLSQIIGSMIYYNFYHLININFLIFSLGLSIFILIILLITLIYKIFKICLKCKREIIL